MQESYFQARKYNIKAEILGQDHGEGDEKDKHSNKSNAKQHTPRKAAISKLTLSKMLIEEEKSTTSSKLIRSKSGFLNPLKPITVHNPEINIIVEPVDVSVVSPLP
jgi:hypothetical protein